ncbi:MAG TPA: hypothetical protein VKE40_02250 [Gemmataceae bacterium]|nr:hypothetical protein [Gemmataceae bacterium]
MKRLLIFLVVVAVAVGAIDLYRGWFSIGWDSSPGKGQITGTVDEDKIRQDRERAAEKVRDLGNHGATAGEKNKGQTGKE